MSGTGSTTVGKMQLNSRALLIPWNYNMQWWCKRRVVVKLHTFQTCQTRWK